MSALSLDIREQIRDVYLRPGMSQEAVAERYCVSLGLVKKMITQHRREGHVLALSNRAGGKRLLGSEQRERLKQAVEQKPDRTMEALRVCGQLDCSINRR